MTQTTSKPQTTKPALPVRTDFDYYLTSAQALGVSPSELALVLGYARNSWHGWKNSGEIPQVCAVAIKGLVLEAQGKDRVVLVRVPQTDGGQGLVAMIKALGLEYVIL
jgi:hypothetical protein